MNIQETAAAIRANVIEQSNTRPSSTRMVYLSDKHWDLTARYQMLLRK